MCVELTSYRNDKGEQGTQDQTSQDNCSDINHRSLTKSRENRSNGSYICGRQDHYQEQSKVAAGGKPPATKRAAIGTEAVAQTYKGIDTGLMLSKKRQKPDPKAIISIRNPNI